MPNRKPAEELAAEIAGKIESRKAIVGVVGLGYVGLPLVLEFHRQSFTVVGFDIDEEKIAALAEGRSYIEHIPSERVAKLLKGGRFTGTTDMELIGSCDAILICLPTPLTPNREPDLSYIESMADRMAPYMRPGQLVVLESTTYPGTTREVLVPLLENGSGLREHQHFFAAYSPEREDPANKDFSTSTIPKVVGADSPEALAAADALYRSIVSRTVPVSSSRAAEASKLLENIFRCVNIAMVNELKMVFQRMGIDVWEVIGAASTKPFGYMPFWPGPGLGGHCIPIDPFYLTWKAREFEMPTKFIELAGEVNTHMPEYVVGRVMEALNDKGRALKGSTVLLSGLAYKKDVDDLRESPSLKLIELLEARGAAVDYHDPHIPLIKPTREYSHLAGRMSVPIERAGSYDCVLIATDHSAVDYSVLGQRAKLIVDTRNAMSRAAAPAATVVKA